MGWICSPSAENCIITFYSIADELKILSEVTFQYLMALTPGVWMGVIIMFVSSFVVALILSVRAQLIR